jgi:hypothetical protein
MSTELQIYGNNREKKEEICMLSFAHTLHLSPMERNLPTKQENQQLEDLQVLEMMMLLPQRQVDWWPDLTHQ